MKNYSRELSELEEQRRDIMRQIRDYVYSHESEIIAEICKQFNLDAEKNEVHVGCGVCGEHVHAFFRDSTAHRGIRQVVLDGENWVVD